MPQRSEDAACNARRRQVVPRERVPPKSRRSRWRLSLHVQIEMATGEADGHFYLWSGPASIRGPTAFQAVALPTELPDPPLRLPTGFRNKSAHKGSARTRCDPLRMGARGAQTRSGLLCGPDEI